MKGAIPDNITLVQLYEVMYISDKLRSIPGMNSKNFVMLNIIANEVMGTRYMQSFLVKNLSSFVIILI